MIKKAIRDLLLANTGVTGKLATYPFETGVAKAPAIFTSSVIPEDAAFPAIIISHIGGIDFGCRDKRGADLKVDLRVYDDKEGSMQALDDLAWAVWDCCNRANLQPHLQGYVDYGCRAEVPAAMNDEDGFPGYLIQVHARVLEA